MVSVLSQDCISIYSMKDGVQVCSQKVYGATRVLFTRDNRIFVFMKKVIEKRRTTDLYLESSQELEYQSESNNFVINGNSITAASG